MSPLRVPVGRIPVVHTSDIVLSWGAVEADFLILASLPRMNAAFPGCVTLLFTIENSCVISCVPIKQVLGFTPKVTAPQ